MVKVKCPVCLDDFEVKAYRAKPERAHPPCCSMKCARQMLASLGHKPWNSKPDTSKAKARKLYERTTMRVSDIAAKCDVSRSTIQAWANIGNWKLFERTQSARTKYRRAACAKIGRNLKPYEQVHHKDGDIGNNLHSNLHVYPDAFNHSAGHATLEACGFILYKRGLIGFNDRTGSYFVRK